MLGTRRQLLQAINDHGIPMGASTLNRLCMPSSNQGPPIAGWWGRRPLYDLEKGLAWARGLLTAEPVNPVKAGPGRAGRKTDHQHQSTP
jgi:hypothetical protein